LAYVDDAITVEELKKRTSEDSQREAELLKEIQTIPEQPTTHWTKEEIVSHLSKARKTWELADDEKAKKIFIRELFESITINCTTEHVHGAPGKFAEVIVTDFKLLN